MDNSDKKIISLADPILGKKEKEALCGVIDSNWITMGQRVKDFENAFAKMYGMNDAVAVNSCTAGLHLCLLALGIGNGDEVIVPSLTFVATVNAVLYIGATPIFVDIENIEKPHISLRDAQKRCTKKTKAVITMHYAGYIMDLLKWRSFAESNGLKLIEDAAHAPGIEGVGKWSHASAFSFFSNKNMTTAEGGMILAYDDGMINRLKKLRAHGMTTNTLDRYEGHAYSYDVSMLGFNYRMDELRASIGIIQLSKLREWNAHRIKLTEYYRKRLQDSIPEILIPFSKNHKSAAHLMPIILPKRINRFKVMEGLKKDGIQSSIHYPPVHKFTFYLNIFPGIKLKNTEEFSGRELTLPLSPSLTENDVDRIIHSLSKLIN